MMYLVVPALVGAAAAEEFMGRGLAFDAAKTYKEADNTINGANGFADKDMVLFEKGTGVLKQGLTAGTLYCVASRTATSFKLKAVEGANNGNWKCSAADGADVALTANDTNKGSATNKFYEVTLCDGKADAAVTTFTTDKATKFHTKDGCNMANGSHVAYAGPATGKTAHPNAKVVAYAAGTDATWYTVAGVVEKGKTFTLKTTGTTPADVITTNAQADVTTDSKQHYWFVRNAADKQFPLVAAAGGNAARSASMVAMTILGAAAMVFA